MNSLAASFWYGLLPLASLLLLGCPRAPILSGGTDGSAPTALDGGGASSEWNCAADPLCRMFDSGACACVGPGIPPVGDPSGWNCHLDRQERFVCQHEGDLPPGGWGWRCHPSSGWTCCGTSVGHPSGNGWTCQNLGTNATLWTCSRPTTSEDTPPGGGNWACVKGEPFGGTLCEEADPEEPPPQYPGFFFPKSKPCTPSSKMWCDGLQYSGWGQVECDPQTRRWKTKVVNGKEMIDCQEFSTGERPDNCCAAYHFFFNPSCCERSDCVLLAGTRGRAVPPSAGGLCDYCQPMASECVEDGARCIITNAHENFCGRPCGPSAPCPLGYSCLTIKLPQGSEQQCVPLDYSCYY